LRNRVVRRDCERLVRCSLPTRGVSKADLPWRVSLTRNISRDAVMFARIRLLLELIRFSHTVFALPFALASAALAWRDKSRDQPISPREFALDLLGILLCMVFARSTAMAFNRIADRHYDAANPRTTTRHLPAGKISLAAVWSFTIVCAAAFIASTLLFVA